MTQNKLIPPLHDGLLVGVLVNDQEARIFVKTESGRPFTLILSAVKRLSVEGFAEGNTIFDCEVSADSDVPNEILAALNNGSKIEHELEKLRTLVAEGSYQVLAITPSFGGAVVGLFKELRVVEEHQLA